MKINTFSGTTPQTEDECRQEIDRMAVGIRAMLDSSRRSIQRSKQMAQENQKILEELEQRLSRGKN